MIFISFEDWFIELGFRFVSLININYLPCLNYLNIVTTGAKVAMTVANHPVKNTYNIKRVKSVRKRSRMVQRSRIRISDQDEVSPMSNDKLNFWDIMHPKISDDDITILLYRALTPNRFWKFYLHHKQMNTFITNPQIILKNLLSIILLHAMKNQKEPTRLILHCKNTSLYFPAQRSMTPQTNHSKTEHRERHPHLSLLQYQSSKTMLKPLNLSR